MGLRVFKGKREENVDEFRGRAGCSGEHCVDISKAEEFIKYRIESKRKLPEIIELFPLPAPGSL